VGYLSKARVLVIFSMGTFVPFVLTQKSSEKNSINSRKQKCSLASKEIITSSPCCAL